jgi:Tn3 transposase DDE domain
MQAKTPPNAVSTRCSAKALTALGGLVKTIHILRYIHEEPLRQAIQLQLNRGEFRHILAKWLFFANQGDFRAGDYEEIMNKASCLSPALQRCPGLEHRADRAHRRPAPCRRLRGAG